MIWVNSDGDGPGSAVTAYRLRTMTRIVRTAYRLQRPPRKQQAALLAGPAVVTKRDRRPKATPAAVTAPPPANDDRKPAIVTAAPRRGRKGKVWQDGGPPDAAMRAWLEKAKWGRGPAG